MRLLLVDDDPRYRALLRHHVTCNWQEAELDAYNPTVHGPLQPEFLAQGYDAVFLDHSWKNGSGLDWLSDLAAREGFAPVIFMSESADDEMGGQARAAGAFAVIGKAKVDHAQLLDAIGRAAAKQQEAQTAWRNSEVGRDATVFGAVTVPGYRCIRKLASGSISDLYLAESEKAGSLVVFKVTRDPRKEGGVDLEFERFVQEFEIVKRARHQSIVRLYDLGEANGHAYLVMEYFANGDLRKRLREGCGTAESLGYGLQIARALEALHKTGTLHRDLKPGNIMLRDDGTIALIDFGLAKQAALEHEITDKGLIFGTPHYMSPEQGHGQPLDERSDLYSLGVMLFEMLTHEKPYDAENPMTIIYKHAKAPIPRLPEALASLQTIIDRLLAKDPAERYPTARAAAIALFDAAKEFKDAELAA